MRVDLLERQSAPIESRQSLPIREQIYNLSKAELITPDCVAYHGTSIEAIEYMLEFGFIPGYASENYDELGLPQYGDIYFGPRENVSWDEIPSTKGLSLNGTDLEIQSIGAIAGGVARGHRFCKLLGLPISMYGFFAEMLVEEFGNSNVFAQDARREINPIGIPEERIEQAVIDAKQRKGVIVGLHRNALKVFPFSIGDSGDDIRISRGLTRLTPDYLTVIQPLGEEEKQFFAEML